MSKKSVKQRLFISGLLVLMMIVACQSCGPFEVKPEDHDHSGPVFVATTEFQQVLPNQALPPGLHYKIDMATGTLN